MAVNLVSSQSILPDHHINHSHGARCKASVPSHLLRKLRLVDHSQPSVSRTGSRCRRSLRCAAVTGGSRRDVEKLIAKTQHRRPRHRKGMTPTKSELLNELQEEEETEEDIDMLARLAYQDPSSSTHDEIDTVDPAESQSAQAEEIPSDEGSNGSTISADGSSRIPDHVKIDQGLISSNMSQATTTDLESTSNRLSTVTEDVVSDTVSEGMETQELVVNNVMEGVQTVANTARETLARGVDDAISGCQERTTEAEASLSAVAKVAMDTGSDTARKFQETQQQLGKDAAEAAAAGRSLLEDASEVVSGQLDQVQSQAGEALQEESVVLEQGYGRLRNEANKSLNQVQDSVQRVAQESTKAAESIRKEAFGFGEVLLDTAIETFKSSPNPFDDNKGIELPSESQGLRQNDQPTGEREKSEKPEENKPNPYTSFKVLIAGATGRTGRLIAENLVEKGATVKAMVRDAFKARSIPELKQCQVVEADLYKYETLKKAVTDCNVVICAIGVRSFPFDPFNSFQVEYEGVLNLVSAAKNNGTRKFVLISTIGVTYFQLVPLLFWKKQAELYLQRSGLDYTIVRPGGLTNKDKPEQVLMQSADSQIFGGISRQKVAEVCVSALVASDASEKIIEVVSVPGTENRSLEDLFKLV